MTPKRKVNFSGLNEELAHTIEERITQFELKHEPDLLSGGPGWVPRVRKLDYAIAIFINAAIALWLVITFIE